MIVAPSEIPIVTSIAGLSKTRKAWFCDVWGVLHNGEKAFDRAVDACRTFKEQGGIIVLISNSPRPSPGVIELLRGLGIFENTFNALVTSGDVTRSLVAEREREPMFHLGPERDRSFFDGLNVKFTPPTKAAVIVCTGLFDDENETPEDYAEMLQGFARRGVPMICANPDLVVERGSRLLPCAGALAVLYAAMGGTVIQAGKPFRPIYELAFEKLQGRVEPADVLAIGDGIDTDIKGAAGIGLDAVYIASQVHLRAGMKPERLNSEVLRTLFRELPFRPVAAMSELVW